MCKNNPPSTHESHVTCFRSSISDAWHDRGSGHRMPRTPRRDTPRRGFRVFRRIATTSAVQVTLTKSWGNQQNKVSHCGLFSTLGDGLKPANRCKGILLDPNMILLVSPFDPT